MDKLKMHTPNLVDGNIAKIAVLFPNAVTEVKEHGETRLAIDFDVLRQELSEDVVEGAQERYQFTWPDKKKSVLLANAPINKTLRPCREESVGRDGTPGGFDSENLYIEGDNLEVLKLLQETYLGKVKMIYIDPPYNTGNDFVYEDDFSIKSGVWSVKSGDYDDEGNRLVQNTESNGRFHTDWLNMMYPRLKLAKDLLSDDGVIFISIDDNESENLKKMCEEIFGYSCFVANVAWQRTYSTRNDSKGIVSEVEHLMVYSKQAGWSPNKLPRTAEMNAIYKNPDNDIEEWTSDNPFAPGAATHQGMVYAIQHPFTGELIYPAVSSCWRYQQNEMLNIMTGWGKYHLKNIDDAEKRATICGISPEMVRSDVKAIVLSTTLEEAARTAEQIYKRGQWPKFYFTKGGKGGIRRKTYFSSVGGKLPTNFWPYSDVGHTDEAKKELKTLFNGNVPFDTPKPVRLLEFILTIATTKDDTVLDFFSGSATTAHAVISKNSMDEGHRKFILVQLPEKSSSPDYDTLCEIGKERIRRAGRKIKSGMLSVGCRVGEDAQPSIFETPNLDSETPHSTLQTPNSTLQTPNLDYETPNSTLQTPNCSLDIGFRVLKCESSNMKDVYYTPDETEVSLFDTLADNIKEDRTPEDLLFQVMLDLGVELSSSIAETEIAGKRVFKVADGFLMACFDENVTEETIKAIAKQKPYYFVMRDSSMANDSVAANFEQIFATYSPETVRKVL